MQKLEVAADSKTERLWSQNSGMEGCGRGSKRHVSWGLERWPQRLRALTALLEVLSSIPSNHMVVHNHL